MPIKTPDETVYFYENSYGKFRLTYFIPYSELVKLNKNNKIEKQVLEDFPDGVDLRVEEIDYKNFKERYGYRSKVEPETAKQLFFTFLSSTKDWKKNRGTGLIPARELDQRITHTTILQTPKETMKIEIPVTRKVDEKKIFQTEKKEMKRYRTARKNQIKEQKEIETLLKKFKPQEIDPSKTLQMQQFTIRYTEGESIEDVFSRIQHKRRPKP